MNLIHLKKIYISEPIAWKYSSYLSILRSHLGDTRRSNLPIGTLIHEGIGLGWRQQMYRELRGKQQPLFLELMVKRLACKKEESREER